jgi:hypothetical protein
MTVQAKRSIAQQARAFAKAEGITEGHGARGRVSANVVFQFLSAQKPSTVRQIADSLGVEHTGKGKISQDLLLSVTDAVAKNTPKAAE